MIAWFRRWRERRRRPSALVQRAFKPDNLDDEWVDARVHEFSRRNDLCQHDDPLCRRYGCPDDPNWKGDGCAP